MSKNGYWRTIKDGAVRINGVTYYVAENYLPYDGRLDGRECLFHLYPIGESRVSFHAALWGTRQYYDGDERDTPQVVDGGYVWDVWTPAAAYVYAMLEHADNYVRHYASVNLEHSRYRIRAL